ncbi:MAG TPA: hypothetical protein VIY48_20770 [Candidatus Paceibacterota bacterium]
MSASTAQRYAWFQALKDVQASMEGSSITGQARMDKKLGLM